MLKYIEIPQDLKNNFNYFDEITDEFLWYGHSTINCIDFKMEYSDIETMNERFKLIYTNSNKNNI